ncbi:MAG: tRNA lysidine(34) synthetase TilS [Streptococcaceae bacterium]|jgi:tRNA(Ile)-lysidine synthase|nr:tRNA lysidine(34) synthetase TilS [Streptococcaceae bacterium]
MHLEKKFFHHLRQKKLIKPGSSVLLAFSGGSDSVALFHLLKSVQQPLNIRFTLVYINHQLRETNALEEEFVRSFAEQEGVPLIIRTWMPTKVAVEENARKFRYATFQNAIENGDFDTLVTAHHGDDLAEGVLMQLTRGNLPYRLATLSEKREFSTTTTLVRPLLPYSKRELVEYCEQGGFEFIVDETNESQRYFRNRVRKHLLPRMKAENPKILEQMTYLSETSRYVEEFLRKKVEEDFLSMQVGGKLEGLRGRSQAEQFVYLEFFFKKKEIYLGKEQVQMLLNSLSGEQFPKFVQISANTRIKITKDAIEIVT